jgi:hypothetical protein
MKLVIVRMVIASVGAVVIAAVNAVEVDVIFNAASRPKLNKSKNWGPIWQNSNSRCRLSKNAWLIYENNQPGRRCICVLENYMVGSVWIISTCCLKSLFPFILLNEQQRIVAYLIASR